MFQEVWRGKASFNIIHQVRQAVLSGALKAGDKLPPEKELLSQFGVSKHTLREALRGLEAIGLLCIRKGAGGGPVVMEVDMETAKDSLVNFLHFKNISIQELSEVRRVLEPYLARVAAERMENDQIEKLSDLNRTCRDALTQNEKSACAEFEVEFHTMLAKASGNPVLILILDLVNNLLKDLKHIIKPDGHFSEKVLYAHERILDALRAHDPEAAERHMFQHVCAVEGDLAEIMKKNQT